MNALEKGDVDTPETFIRCEGSKKVSLTDEFPEITMSSREFEDCRSNANGSGTTFMRRLLEHFIPLDEIAKANRAELEKEGSKYSTHIKAIFGKFFLCF